MIYQKYRVFSNKFKKEIHSFFINIFFMKISNLLLVCDYRGGGAYGKIFKPHLL